MSKKKRDYSQIITGLLEESRKNLSYEFATGILQRLGFEKINGLTHVRGFRASNADLTSDIYALEGQRITVPHSGFSGDNAIDNFLDVLEAAVKNNEDFFWKKMRGEMPETEAPKQWVEGLAAEPDDTSRRLQ